MTEQEAKNEKNHTPALVALVVFGVALLHFSSIALLSKNIAAENTVQQSTPQEQQAPTEPKTSSIIRYRDAKGRLHYVDSIEKIPAEHRDSIDASHKLPPITKTHFAEHEDIAPSRTSETVEVFVTDWCSVCTRLEKFLRKEGIPYRRYNIDKNTLRRKEFKKLGGSGVPLVKIGPQVLKGFNRKAILNALGR